MRHLILSALLAVCTTAAAVTPTSANAQSYSASKLIYNFDIGTLRAVVSDMGGSVRTKDNGDYEIQFANGTVSGVEFTVCGSGKCFGTHLKATFGKPSDKSVAETERLVEQFNKDIRTVKSYSTGEGRSTVSMYIISDGGLTMENYRMQLAVMEDALQIMRETIYTNG